MAALGVGALFSSIFVGGIINHMTRGKVFLLLGFTSSLTPIGMGLSSQTGISVIAAVHDGAGHVGVHDHHSHGHPVGGAGRDTGAVSSAYSMHIGGSMAFANLLYGTPGRFLAGRERHGGFGSGRSPWW